MNEELNLSWSDVEQAVNIILNRIGNKKYDFVIGIANGGLIPATLIAKKLKVKTLSIGVSSYNDKTHLTNLDLWSNINTVYPNLCTYGSCLLVDDISDTGKTFRHLKQYYFPDLNCVLDTASLVIKPQTTFIPNYFAMSANEDTWVKFPWE